MKGAPSLGLKLTSLVTAAILAGCAANPGPVSPARSLGSNRRLPGAEIRALYPPQLWDKLRGEDYSAYVIVEADVSRDRLIQRKILASYPDSSRNALALALLDEVDLKVSTVGTNIIPRAAAFVIFYERNLTGDLAIIYAKQQGYSAPGENSDPRGKAKAQFFLARKL